MFKYIDCILCALLGVFCLIKINRVNFRFKVCIASLFKFLSIGRKLLPGRAPISFKSALHRILSYWQHVFFLVVYQRHGGGAIPHRWLSSLLNRLLKIRYRLKETWDTFEGSISLQCSVCSWIVLKTILRNTRMRPFLADTCYCLSVNKPSCRCSIQNGI